jgi:predicted dehydrogenase
VYADLDYIDLAEGRTDCRFSVAITHVSGVRSRLSSSKVNHIDEREWRAYGSLGSYVARGTDVQAQAIFAGARPAAMGDKWGYDDEAVWGTLRTATGSVRVPSEQGAYQDLYTRFAAAVRGDGPFPVPATEAVHTLEVLDAARTSATEGRVVNLPDEG